MKRKNDLDPYEEMMRGVLTFGFIVFLTACVLILTGCVNAPVAPNLKLPDPAAPKLKLPPVPQDAELVIHGDKIEADKGGQQLLRGYVACRAALH